MNPRFEVITLDSPDVEPVSLTEAKAQLRLTASFSADDTYITSLIPVARDRAEKYTNRYFTDSEIKIVYFGPFPASNNLLLPFPNLVSVDEITYLDGNNATIIISNSEYTFDSDTRTIYNVGSGWPAAQNFKVTVVTAPPLEFEGVKQAILMMLTDMYETRTESVVGTIVSINPAVKAALAPYRFSIGI